VLGELYRQSCRLHSAQLQPTKQTLAWLKGPVILMGNGTGNKSFNLGEIDWEKGVGVLPPLSVVLGGTSRNAPEGVGQQEPWPQNRILALI
jgi:hypothetical protein